MREANPHLPFPQPSRIIADAGICAGQTVADFGCAAGYFTLPAARAVGESGTVYALDVLPEVLSALESRARLMGRRNIVTRHANLETSRGSGLDDGSVAWVILKNVLYMSPHPDAIMVEARRVLAPDGRVLVVEWNGQYQGMGPAEDRRIAQDTVTALATAAGFTQIAPLPVGQYHYGLILAG